MVLGSKASQFKFRSLNLKFKHRLKGNLANKIKSLNIEL